MSSIRSRAPSASSPTVRRVMQANVEGETTPEIALRRAFRERRVRFSVDAKPLRGLRCRADLVFRRHRVCVFVDGCFWHGCPKHFRPPKANRAWWIEKIAANVERDERQAAELRAKGWTVVRVWEHAVARSASAVVAMIESKLALAGSSVQHGGAGNNARKR